MTEGTQEAPIPEIRYYQADGRPVVARRLCCLWTSLGEDFLHGLPRDLQSGQAFLRHLELIGQLPDPATEFLNVSARRGLPLFQLFDQRPHCAPPAFCSRR